VTEPSKKSLHSPRNAAGTGAPESVRGAARDAVLSLVATAEMRATRFQLTAVAQIQNAGTNSLVS
jgi:hypothetical protein